MAKGTPSGRSKDVRRARREIELRSLKELQQRVDSFVLDDDVKLFSQLPLSSATQRALKSAHYVTCTDIQRQAIPRALRGRDILGAARTGSGKTLAFLIPILECLVRKQWTRHDGLGALVISPTRELAVQIFEVLRKIGHTHDFSAGLVIGGKDLAGEQARLTRMNILVGTPGRLLQHMDQTAAFDVDQLQILALDEADRILDMGFKGTMDAIIKNLPKTRQTLLFSATQTKSIQDLARLSLTDPEYVSTDDSAHYSTPKGLEQYCLTATLPEKLDVLYGFIRTHLKVKALVFLSSCKQVRYVFEAFRHLQPGVPLMHIHGKQKQTARADVTQRFSRSKHAYLFCTDVVARGLDFAAVDWVIQVDAPEDADTYIHRVGRTARYDRAGKALLFLQPSEAKFLDRLSEKRVPIDKLVVKQSKKQSIKAQLQHMCFKDPELKYLGQKALVSYAKSIYVQPDKEVFNLEEMPLDEFASSLGLPGTPAVRFGKKTFSSRPQSAAPVPKPDTDEASVQATSQFDRLKARQNNDVLSQHRAEMIDDGSSDSDQDFMQLRRTDHELEQDESDASDYGGVPLDKLSKRKQLEAVSRKKSLKHRPRGEKIVYDDEGRPHSVYEFTTDSEFADAKERDKQIQDFVQREREALASRDAIDKSEAKLKRKEKIRKRLEAQRARDQESQSDEEDVSDEAPMLAHDGEAEDDVDGEDGHNAGADGARPLKRPRKWFERDEDDADQRVLHVSNPATIADQEALALQLLQG